MVDATIEILEHTADLAIRIRAVNEADLFKLGARGVYQALGKLVAENTQGTTYKLKFQAENLEDLFHDWLAEILYYAQVRHILFDLFEFQTLSPTQLYANAVGRSIDVGQSEFQVEIKAVTYHHLKIERTNEGLMATVIFDV